MPNIYILILTSNERLKIFHSNEFAKKRK